MAKYIEVTTQEELDKLVKEGVCLVDYWAPWCGPCRMIAPIIEELAEDYDGKATIIKVNTDAAQELAVSAGVRGVPTINFYKDGNVVETIVGGRSKAEFSQSIDKLLQ